MPEVQEPVLERAKARPDQNRRLDSPAKVLNMKCSATTAAPETYVYDLHIVVARSTTPTTPGFGCFDQEVILRCQTTGRRRKQRRHSAVLTRVQWHSKSIVRTVADDPRSAFWTSAAPHRNRASSLSDHKRMMASYCNAALHRRRRLQPQPPPPTHRISSSSHRAR